MRPMLLSVKLTDDELRLRRDRLGDTVQEYEAISLDNERAAEGWKEEKKERESKEEKMRQALLELGRAIKSGKELRLVEVEERPNVASRMIEIWRLDEETIVDVRPMSSSELEKYATKDLFEKDPAEPKPTRAALAGEELPAEPTACDPLDVAEQWAAGWVHDPAARTTEEELAASWAQAARIAGIEPNTIAWKRTIKEATGCVRVRDGSGYNVRRYTEAELCELAANEARPVNTSSPIIDV